MDYILRISGDFKKGDCKKCEFHYLIGQSCILDTEECPLEEVKEMNKNEGTFK